MMRGSIRLAGFALAVVLATPAAAAPTRILFIGNSFTYGPHDGVIGFQPGTVTDLNGNGMGGVPAMFKGLTVQAGLDYDVSLEAIGGASLATHYNNRLGVLDRPWDVVVMQTHSVLDPTNPGNPASLITYAGLLAQVFAAQNPSVDIYLTATWPRADLTYATPSPWFGQPISAMAADLQAGQEQAAAAIPQVTDVIEVGAAWNDAMVAGLADANPYDGITAGQINLWAADSYHASSRGSYLSALTQFATITGYDPRQLGGNEAVAAHFGLAPGVASQLQTIAHDRALLSAAVPEPASWALLVAGFGLTGAALRRGRTRAAAVQPAG